LVFEERRLIHPAEEDDLGAEIFPFRVHTFTQSAADRIGSGTTPPRETREWTWIQRTCK
jgi:hypothetical protein